MLICVPAAQISLFYCSLFTCLDRIPLGLTSLLNLGIIDYDYDYYCFYLLEFDFRAHLREGARRICRALGPRVRQQAAGGPCRESGASGRELAGRGGGGRGEKRKEAPGASETKKRVRPGIRENRVTVTHSFVRLYPCNPSAGLTFEN